MKSVTTLFCLLIMNYYSFSQAMIRGNVSDNIGPLIGANIILKNTQRGAITDFDGNYEIEAKALDTLSISYLGYRTEEIPVGKQIEINSILIGGVELDEVKIVAYGSTKRCCVLCCGIVRHLVNNNFKSNIIKESLYPNPSKQGYFKLGLLKDYKNVEIQVSNMSGQTIFMKNYKFTTKTISIDLTNQGTGMYIISIIADGEVLPSKKAIIG